MFKSQSGKLLMVTKENELGDFHCEGLFKSKDEVEQYKAESEEDGHIIGEYKLYRLVEA